MDTTIPTDEIFQQFTKVTRYDIRRSYRDEINIVYHWPNELKKDTDIYDSFKVVYNEMYRAKGLTAEAPVESMRLYANNDALMISEVKLDCVPIVYHAYIIDGQHARLWMSCSVFRDSEDKQFRALIGRANKRLHYEDIVTFSKREYRTYDLGGVSSFDNPSGIDQFKMSFGGEPISYYDETIICSYRYKLFYKIKQITKSFLRK